MTPIEEVSPIDYKVVGTVPTEPGARTMAHDTKTHHVFTVTAKMAPAAPGAQQVRRRRNYQPNSFAILECGR